MNREALIEEFKTLMINSTNSSSWWKDHLSEQINAKYGDTIDGATKDAIHSAIETFIITESFSVSQFFNNAKTTEERREIFAIATNSEKRAILSRLNERDKISMLNDNPDIKINDIYEMLISDSFTEEDKIRIVLSLEDNKIKELKENYSSLDESLHKWLGSKYEEIFKEEMTNLENQQSQGVSSDTSSSSNSDGSEPPEKVENEEVVQPEIIEDTSQLERENELLESYRLSTDKVAFFEGLIETKDKDLLFNKLSIEDKKNIISNSNIDSITKYFIISNNKEQILSLMPKDKIKEMYNISDDETKKLISNVLYNIEHQNKENITNSINGISKEVSNIENLHQSIIASKSNIDNLKDSKKDVSSAIKDSKVIIKKLEKRKERLERKLINTAMRMNDRVSLISKIRLNKIKRIINDINQNNTELTSEEARLNSYEQKASEIGKSIDEEKISIEKSKESIRKANEHISEFGRINKNSRVEVKEISKLHKELIGRRKYNHDKKKIIMTTSKTKTQTIVNANRQTEGARIIEMPKREESHVEQTPSKVAQSEQRVEQELRGLGIEYHPEEYVAAFQDPQYLTEERIASMTPNEAMMMQLYFEAQYAKKMVEIAKQQQEMSTEGRGGRLSRAGFSNIIILILSLAIISLFIVLVSMALK